MINAAMRLLLIEDDIKIAQFVISGLREAGFAVDHAADGEDGLYLTPLDPITIRKAYAESINGTIHVKSILNQGSCFTLIF